MPSAGTPGPHGGSSSSGGSSAPAVLSIIAVLMTGAMLLANKAPASASAAPSSSSAARRRERRRRAPNADVGRIVPRGAEWLSATNDFEDWDKLPEIILTKEFVRQHWSSIPTHTPLSDPFHASEGLVEALVWSKLVTPVSSEQILRDLPRTFPKDKYFESTDVQDSMRRVLTAISVEFPEIGYVQSMNFIVGFLMLHAKTEDGAFALMRRLMEHPRLCMKRVFSPGLPLLMEMCSTLQVLVRKHVPLAASKLEELGIEPLLYAQTWIMTVFTYNLDWSICTDLWSEFFEKGWVAVVRLIVHLVASNQADLLRAADFEGAVEILRDAVDECKESVVQDARREIVFDEEDLVLLASLVDQGAAVDV